MSTSSHVSSKVTAIIAIVFLMPALIFFIMWSSIGLHSSGLNEKEKISLYLEYFPGFMQNLAAIHIISISCCLISIMLAARSFKKRQLGVRVMMFLTVIVAFFIILFDIYQII